MTQQFFKGLFLAIMSIVVMYFGQQPVDYTMLAIAAVSTVLTYTGKNLLSLFPSDSPAGALSWINLGAGVLVAVGTGVMESVGLYLIEGAILWPIVWKVVLSALFTYLGATFFAPQHSVAKVRGFVSPSVARSLKPIR